MKSRALFWVLLTLWTILLFIPSAQAVERLELDKAVFAPGEALNVYFYGLTDAEIKDQCWVAIAEKDASSGSYMEWSYIKTLGDGVIQLDGPGSLGSYELRFFRGYSSSEENLVRDKSVPFTVSYGKTVESVTLDQPVYSPGQYMAVSYAGVTPGAAENRAWIGISRPGDPADSYMDWKEVQAGSGTMWLDVPKEAGSYEVRYYPANRASEENLADGLRIPFDVAGELPGDDHAIYPTRNDFDWDLLTFTPSLDSWTGAYETNFKTLYLHQAGNAVAGEYPEWDDGRVDGFVQDGILYGYWYEYPDYTPPNNAGQFVCALYPDGQGFQGWWRYGNNGAWKDWSSGTLNRQIASAAMKAEVYAAAAHRLIPDCLQGADLTQPITAAEFSALAIRLFEEIWQTQEIPEKTPYTNIAGHSLQSEIEKAWGLGFLNPIRPESFAPDSGFSREMMARMYCNVIRACEFDDFTRENIDGYFLPYTVSGHFADEGEISAGALDAVLYMTGSGLMDGVGDNRFDPASKATREQAVVTAERVYQMQTAEE